MSHRLLRLAGAAAVVAAAPACVPTAAVAAVPRLTGAALTTTAGDTYRATGSLASGTLATNDPAGRRLRLTRAAATVGVSVVGDSTGVASVSLTFAAGRGERWMGFGERSDAVVRRSGTVENEVSEGPYASNAEYSAVTSTVPPWGLRRARDATYFPMPWLLSTRGYGALIEQSQRSRFHLGRSSWTAQIDALQLTIRLFAGSRPADALRAMSGAIGRQPAPTAPWLLGPWVQTGHDNEEPEEGARIEALVAADAPLSAVETHMRYLPCEDNLGRDAELRARTAALNAQGAAALAYMNNEVCADTPLFAAGAPQGAFQRTATGQPYTFTAFVGGRGPTPIAQFDYSAPAGVSLWQSVADRTTADGFDGFMEDYGEYTPPDSVSANGMAGTEMHNLYPVLYHGAGWRWAQRQPRPVARWVRSGWTGSAASSQIVWGGDNTTGWGYDGLASAVKEALSMGLSGVSMWGSDIGGFFTLGDQKLTPELLARWVQFGAVSGVMRTKGEGIGIQPLPERPAVWQPQNIPIWRRYAKLRTQLYPYLVAAQAQYRATGMPLMRALVLEDPRGASVDDAFGVGDDLLAAPVLKPGARTRSAWLPRGRWYDLWSAVSYDRRSGALRLTRRPEALRGRSTVRVPAPLDRLPLFVRAGAVLPLLPADVDTLAQYGSRPGLIKLADRRDDLVLLAFPRRRSSGRFDLDGRWASALRGRTWTLSVSARRTRHVTLQATLPFRARAVTINGHQVAWSQSKAGVLRARFDARRSTVRVISR
jgi:alpha-glucosidase (family GH31 glycosyl hydrolase)